MEVLCRTCAGGGGHLKCGSGNTIKEACDHGMKDSKWGHPYGLSSRLNMAGIQGKGREENSME